MHGAALLSSESQEDRGMMWMGIVWGVRGVSSGWFV